ncbi:MAG: peptidyl-prolyl cis-trans isomerase [Armatimonadota bacterium]|nr:peptidyl-prolyl cis-trans isomerase [Armatimonadota bacterium]
MHRRVLCRIRAIIIAALAALLVGALGSCTPTERQGVVARVGDEAITATQLIRELRARRGPSTLVAMIDGQLIRQAAAEAGIEVTQEEMRLRWERAVAEAGSEADLDAVLERRGLSRERLREMLHTDLLLDKLARETMAIDEQEVKDFYQEHREDYELGERVKARMIMLNSKSDAQAVLETLNVGGDFAGLAKAVSIDPATRDQSGDMGWFEREDYATAITDAAFAAEAGELVGPIEAPDGWVLLKVEGHKPPGHKPLEEVRDEVTARIRRAKLPSARAEWMRRAREEATIEIRDDELREETRRLLEHAPPPQPVTLLPVPPAQ